MKNGHCIVLLTISFLLAPFLSAQATPTDNVIRPNDSRLTVLGRYDDRDPLHPRFAYPGSGFVCRFQGTSADLEITSTSADSALTLVIDHASPQLKVLTPGTNLVTIGPLDSGPHTVEVYKRTETWQGIIALLDIRLPKDATLLPPPPQPTRKLMFIGDSVTCGAGIDNNDKCGKDPALPANNAYESYGMILGRRLDAQTHLVCYGGRGLVRDYRGLGEADGVLTVPQFSRLAIPEDNSKERIDWNSARFEPNAIVVSLGTNDFNLEKTKPLDPESWVRTYANFVRELRHSYPKAIIFLTEGAIVTDPRLRQYVQQTVAQVHNKKVRYMQSQHYPGNGCDAHPTRSQQIHMADDVEPFLRQSLGW